MKRFATSLVASLYMVKGRYVCSYAMLRNPQVQTLKYLE